MTCSHEKGRKTREKGRIKDRYLSMSFNHFNLFFIKGILRFLYVPNFYSKLDVQEIDGFFYV